MTPNNQIIEAIRKKIAGDPNGGIMGKTVRDMLGEYDALAGEYLALIARYDNMRGRYSALSAEMEKLEKQVAELQARIEEMEYQQLHQDL